MIRYETSEDAVEITGNTHRTFTRGSMQPLYVGPDAAAAAESLEMSGEQFAALLSSDVVAIDGGK